MFDYDYDRENIIRELGIEASEPDFKAHVLIRIEQLLDERMKTEVESKLTDDDMQEFNAIETREAAQEFLRSRITDLDTLYEEALSEIVNDLKLTLEA